MAGILCEQCGYENAEGATVCEICAEPLRHGGATTTVPDAVPPVKSETVEENRVTAQNADSNTEYFVMCPESSTKNIVESGNITSFYCQGCQKEHVIDNFLWTVESRQLSGAGETPATATETRVKQNNLWLEDTVTHHRIDISKTGGTLGRYGTFGASYFQSRGLNTVSGEHCMIRYELDNWVLFHVSRTNQTKYDGMILASNEPTLLEDGKILVLANAVSFIVRID